MRSFLIVSMVIGVVSVAYWAYQENIKTQAALAYTQELQDDIGEARAKLSILHAEWAYLNRPERLQDFDGSKMRRRQRQQPETIIAEIR